MVKGLVMGIVVACTALASAEAAYAQEAGAGVGIGVKAGLAFPQFSTDDFHIDNRAGWQAGVFFGGNRGGVVGVQGEINFLSKRAAYPTMSDLKVTLDYLQIPVLLRLHSPSRSAAGFQLYGIVGPSFDLKLRESFEGVTISGDDAFETFDLGGIVGAGVEAGTISVEGRYSRGFRQINKNFRDINDLKSHSFSVLLGIRFK